MGGGENKEKNNENITFHSTSPKSQAIYYRYR